MYDTRTNFIIGFHGCEKQVRDALLVIPDVIRKSEEPFDWLGHGMYFWENNEQRAMEFAVDKKSRGKIKDPAIIGSVLQLGYCCDFLDSRFTQLLVTYYKILKDRYEKLGKPLPRNQDVTSDKNGDKLLRHLDCAVIELMHSEIEKEYKRDKATKGYSDLKIFDSTRGVFMEGGAVFEGAGISKKGHIQICIRNSNCIKGFFLPRREIEFLPT